MIERAAFVQTKWWGRFGGRVDPDELSLAARKLADNIKICSCRGCCNVRRSYGWQGPAKTIQERRALLEEQEQRTFIG